MPDVKLLRGAGGGWPDYDLKVNKLRLIQVNERIGFMHRSTNLGEPKRGVKFEELNNNKCHRP